MIVKTLKPLDWQVEMNWWYLYIQLWKNLIKLKMTHEQELDFIKQTRTLDIFKQDVELIDLPF